MLFKISSDKFHSIYLTCNSVAQYAICTIYISRGMVILFQKIDADQFSKSVSTALKVYELIKQNENFVKAKSLNAFNFPCLLS